MKFRQLIGKYFYFSAGERRGVFVLLVLLLIVYLYPVLKNFGDTEKGDGLADERFYLDSLISHGYVPSSTPFSGESEQNTLFQFDPNSADSVSLHLLGLSSRQIANVINYRKKGGLFRSSDDLLTLYTIDSITYYRLKAFVCIEPVKREPKKTDNRIYSSKKYRFNFDPNTISSNGWDSLGVPSHIVRIIGNYLASGARFGEADDLKRIYGFTDSLYVELKPFVKIISHGKRAIELNCADSLELMSLPGIGPVLSGRIIRYRKLLGGYYCREQLLEVYGLRPDVFKKMKPLVEVDTNCLRKIDVNRADVTQIKRHPYVETMQAWDIVRYRKRNGRFFNVSDLMRCKLLPDSVFVRVHPYLNCQVDE